MIGPRTIANHPARLWRRLPVVLALTLGLLMSLVQSIDCCTVFASDYSAVAMLSTDGGSSQSGADQPMPVHSCHCLCHIATPATAGLTSPAELPLRSPAFAGDTSPPSLAGLPLDEPPRV
jgi:hypothetical protein